MGQYYKVVNIDKSSYIDPYDFDNGVKLMEHSYMFNDFVEIVEHLLAVGKLWYKNRIVWAGDYADDEREDSHFYKKHPDCKHKGNLYGLVTTNKITKNVVPVSINNSANKTFEYKYLVNIDKKVYVDKSLMLKDESIRGWDIHPLPLLTAEGNGRGGGDFLGEGIEHVGSWARDRIIPTNIKPEFELLDVIFLEK